MEVSLAKTKSSTPVGIVRWTACEAFTWVAFGEARPLTGNIEFPEREWSLKWRQWPPNWLPQILEELETGTPWLPDEFDCSPWEAENVRTQARLIIADTGKSISEVRSLLARDLARWEHNKTLLQQAWRDVMSAVRQERLTVWARPASKRNSPKRGAVLECLNGLLFDSSRAISVFGTVEEFRPSRTAFDPREESDFDFLKYDGPWFNDVRFDSSQLKKLYPRSRIPATTPEMLDWMIKEATIFLNKHDSKPKRDDLIRDCRREFDCRFEDAEAVHEQLPAELKRKRGEKVQAVKSAN